MELVLHMCLLRNSRRVTPLKDVLRRSTGWNFCARRNLCSQTFQFGETVLAVDHKRRKKLFQLKENGKYARHGNLFHTEIVGCKPGTFKLHCHSVKVLIRRPTLEEYVTLMKRGPTPSYVKDIWALVGMLNIGPGSCVVEAGSGSGALTLHLSQAVCDRGKVHSFEVREDHLKIAQSNYKQWLSSQALAHSGYEMSENVTFYLNDLQESRELLKPASIDAVFLDVQQPDNVIEAAEYLLKPFCSIVVYLPNITQVIQLVNHVRSRNLLLELDQVVEVDHKMWTVRPATSKHLLLSLEGSEEDEELDRVARPPVNNNHRVPYIARPSYFQKPHTGFLSRLLKRL